MLLLSAMLPLPLTPNPCASPAKHYYLPLTERENAPAAWKLYDHTVCLPYHMHMDEKDVTHVVSSLRALLQSNK